MRAFLKFRKIQTRRPNLIHYSQEGFQTDHLGNMWDRDQLRQKSFQLFRPFVLQTFRKCMYVCMYVCIYIV